MPISRLKLESRIDIDQSIRWFAVRHLCAGLEQERRVRGWAVMRWPAKHRRS